MFWKRTFSGIALIIILILTIYPGGMITLVSYGVISLVGLFEFYRVLGIEKSLPGIMGYITTLVYYANLRLEFFDQHMTWCILFLLALLFSFVIGYPKFQPGQILGAYFGIFYVAVMLSFIYQTRSLDHGLYYTWLIFFSSWGCDTSAYCFGMLFGKHKFVPKLSPKKSVEGALGGILGAALLSAIYGFILQQVWGYNDGLIISFAIICGVGAIFSQLGDLAASAFKRFYDVKDYGNLIPGHGGIMDRFDSVIITAPMIYYLSYQLLTLR